MISSATPGQLFNIGETKLAAFLIFLLIEIFLEGARAATRAEIENHLELGRELLAKGQLSDALSHYHAAVEGDSTNYLTLFKRGTVYYALGKARFALGDFSKVLELKPDFTAAKAQRASVYLKMGDYDNAEKDFIDVLREDSNNEDSHYQYKRIAPSREQWQLVLNIIASGDYRTAISLLTQLIEVSPWSADCRNTRAKCYIEEGDFLAAVSDLRAVNRLSQDSTDGFNHLSRLLYKLGHTTDALTEIRQCLHLDPEHKDCFPFYKHLKKVVKALTDAQRHKDDGQYEDCITAAEKMLKLETEERLVIFEAKRLLCSCYTKDEKFPQAIGQCRDALEIVKDANVYCDRAEAFIGTEMYDDAIIDYKSALELDQNLQKAQEGLEKAKRLQKQSERRDYYKILGVKRTATKQEIVKAYRKAAQKWHPDNFQGDEKKFAEKKFIDIASAKEVLTDPEKRKQFDQGEDPLDPESSSNGFRGGNPFHQFHHGSPFQFKFHFN